MSRPIKFRMWDKEEKVMVDGDSLGFEEYAPICELLSQDGIMQFTGLHDKNGKEIYEGDKVTCRQYVGGNWVEYVYEKGYIGFKNGSFYLVREQGFYKPLDWLIEFDYEIEVTGTIYDNPSLLEVQP